MLCTSKSDTVESSSSTVRHQKGRAVGNKNDRNKYKKNKKYTSEDVKQQKQQAGCEVKHVPVVEVSTSYFQILPRKSCSTRLLKQEFLAFSY